MSKNKNENRNENGNENSKKSRNSFNYDRMKNLLANSAATSIPAEKIGVPRYPLTKYDALSPFELTGKFMRGQTFIFLTPQRLGGVQLILYQSGLRKHGINVISIDFSHDMPNPKEILNKGSKLIVMGNKNVAANYLQTLGGNASKQLMDTQLSMRGKQFMDNLLKFHVGILVNKTLAKAGINLLYIVIATTSINSGLIIATDYNGNILWYDICYAFNVSNLSFDTIIIISVFI